MINALLRRFGPSHWLKGWLLRFALASDLCKISDGKAQAMQPPWSCADAEPTRQWEASLPHISSSSWNHAMMLTFMQIQIRRIKVPFLLQDLGKKRQWGTQPSQDLAWTLDTPSGHWTSNMYPTMPQWTWFWASLFFVLHRSRPNDCSGAPWKAWKKRLPSQNCVVLRLLCLRRVLTCVCLRLHAKLVLWRRSVFKMQIFLKEFCLASPSQTKSGWKAVTKKI